MLRNFKKLISLVLVLSLSVVVSLPAFADVNHNSVKDSGVKDSAITYISQADAELLANQCIKEQAAIGDHCPWNQSTIISATAELFDFEDGVNAYLFRLTTGGKRTGYVFVNAYAQAPHVEAFGYDCDSVLDAMRKSDGKGLVTTGDHVIFGGAFTFLAQNKGSGKYSVVGDKSANIDAGKTDLIQSYKTKLQAKVNVKAQIKLKSLKTGLVKNSVRASDDQPHDLQGINSKGYTVFTTQYFHQFRNCVPTAATNLVYYWAHCGIPKEPRLWTGKVYDNLADDMHYDSLAGTYSYNILPGLEEFASSRNAPLSQTYDDGVDWSALTDRIDSNYPVIVTIQNDPKYCKDGSGHAMLAIGYQRTEDDSLIRVEDGWVDSVKNFYEYSDYYIDGQYSVSW